MSSIPHPTTHIISTEDGWKIALHRYPRPRSQRSPVLLVHGLASNRHNMDFPEKEKSLAQYLWKKGWDTWIVELRGAGKSAKPKPWQWLNQRWNFDHYVLQDLPAAVRFILQSSKRPRLHWVGHSMGGFLVYPFVKTQSADLIHSVLTVGSPMGTDVKPGYFKWTHHIDPVFKVIPFIPYRAAAKLVGAYAEWAFKSDKSILFVRENMSLQTLKLGTKVAIDDVSAGVIVQIHQWLREKSFKSWDGKINYTIDLKKFKLPLLILTGNRDPFTPFGIIRKTFQKIGSAKKRWIMFGRKHGHRTDYGHVDLIIGNHAPREVFPKIAEWLEENEGK